MEVAYVKLDDITNFIKQRNTDLNSAYSAAKDVKQQTEMKLRQKEIKYIMEKFPKIVEPSLVFAEVEEEKD